MPAETSASGKSNSSSSQLKLTGILRNKKAYNQILKKFLDDKVPFRKKVSIILSLLIVSITLLVLFITGDEAGFPTAIEFGMSSLLLYINCLFKFSIGTFCYFHFFLTDKLSTKVGKL